MILCFKLVLSMFSVNDARNPSKPMKISVTRNPSSDTNSISSLVTVKSVVNIRIATASLVPNPANVTGKKPIMFAMGNSRRNI